MTTHSISWPFSSKMCLARKGPYVTGPLMYVLNCLQQTKLWSRETWKLRWFLNGWKNVEQRSQDLVRRTLLFSLFTELESILCLNVSHNSQIVLKCFTEVGLPGNPDVLWSGGGGWGGGPRQETLFLHFFPSRKKIVPFLCSSRIHLKWQAGENENKPFLGRPSTGKCIFDTSVGKWVSRIFWISSKLAVKANTIVLDGLLQWVWGLSSHSRGFYLTLQMEASLEREAWQLSRASQASGNCLWGLFVFSDIKGIRRKKNTLP